MATVTGLTATRMLAIEAATVIGGHVDGSGHLILDQHDGTEIDTGSLSDAIPSANTSVQGKIEIATDAETLAYTDNTRAVTPANLAAMISSLSSTRRLVTEITTAKPQSDLITTYPAGVSIMALTPATIISGSWTDLSSIWSTSISGVVHTINPSASAAVQYFYLSGNSSSAPGMAVRNGDGSGWTQWQRVTLASETASINTALGFLPHRMAAGNFNVTSVASTSVKTSITFPLNRFTAPPDSIQVTANTSTPQNVRLGAQAMTATGVDIYLWRSDVVSTTIWWQAVQM